MNNYEHIMQGGIDAIIQLCIDGCEHYCSESERCGEPSGKGCEVGLREYLESEYVEPVSFDKLVSDIRRVANGINGDYPCAYYGVDSMECKTKCAAGKGENFYRSCLNVFAEDIADRIEGLVKQ